MLTAPYLQRRFAFIVSSVAAGEIFGTLKLDLKLLVVGAAFVFCLARGMVYIAPLSFTGILLLLALASLCDAFSSASPRSGFPSPRGASFAQRRPSL